MLVKISAVRQIFFLTICCMSTAAFSCSVSADKMGKLSSLSFASESLRANYTPLLQAFHGEITAMEEPFRFRVKTIAAKKGSKRFTARRVLNVKHLCALCDASIDMHDSLGQGKHALHMVLGLRANCVATLLKHRPANNPSDFQKSVWKIALDGFKRDMSRINVLEQRLRCKGIHHQAKEFGGYISDEIILRGILQTNAGAHATLLDSSKEALQKTVLDEYYQEVFPVINTVVTHMIESGVSWDDFLSADVMKHATTDEKPTAIKPVDGENIPVLSPLTYYLMSKKVPVRLTPSQYVTILNVKNGSQIPLLLADAEEHGLKIDMYNSMPFQHLAMMRLPDMEFSRIHNASLVRGNVVSGFFADNTHRALPAALVTIITAYDMHPGDDILCAEEEEKQHMKTKNEQWFQGIRNMFTNDDI